MSSRPDVRRARPAAPVVREAPAAKVPVAAKAPEARVVVVVVPVDRSLHNSLNHI